MIKVMVSLDADLASSIALRYACQLTGISEMELQPIHVEQADRGGGSPGSGWVRKTWETALMETGLEEISHVIDAERNSCGPLLPPKLCIGDREDEILRELVRGDYDLLVEGALQSFTSANFSAKLRSHLYRHAPCPIILVRNLVQIQKVALLLTEDQNPAALIDFYYKLFGESSLSLEIIYCQFPSLASFGRVDAQAPQRALDAAQKELADRGQEPDRIKVLAERPAKAAELMRDYGLVMASLGKQHRKGPFGKLLAQSPSPTMLLSSH